MDTELSKDRERIVKFVAAVPTIIVLVYLQNSGYEMQWFGDGSFSHTMSLLIVSGLVFFFFYLIIGFAALKLGFGKNKE